MPAPAQGGVETAGALSGRAKALDNLRLFALYSLRTQLICTGSLLFQAERRATSPRPANLIRVMPAEGSHRSLTCTLLRLEEDFFCEQWSLPTDF
jgi:hypothetical protein